ncbi:hypothetical protein [Lyticum sinuosum]|uniref:Uncharacterized protein n=1 Tax=Lyticum sinuosum TaxID=1332059 RepID=A0AAE4VLK5_9RICK|nr:hypothetical protein [Lyticum sinuosum]MDZ5760873.1 hypothetical protein [Lyticum sinuosum]
MQESNQKIANFFFGGTGESKTNNFPWFNYLSQRITNNYGSDDIDENIYYNLPSSIFSEIKALIIGRMPMVYDEAKQAIEKINAIVENSDSPITQDLPIIINLIGHSRGAVVCLLISNMIAENKILSAKININLVLNDPVPGPRQINKKFCHIPAIVKRVLISYASMEGSPFLSPISPYHFTFESPDTTSVNWVHVGCFHPCIHPATVALTRLFLTNIGVKFKPGYYYSDSSDFNSSNENKPITHYSYYDIRRIWSGTLEDVFSERCNRYKSSGQEVSFVSLRRYFKRSMYRHQICLNSPVYKFLSKLTSDNFTYENIESNLSKLNQAFNLSIKEYYTHNISHCVRYICDIYNMKPKLYSSHTRFDYKYATILSDNIIENFSNQNTDVQEENNLIEDVINNMRREGYGHGKYDYHSKFFDDISYFQEHKVFFGFFDKKSCFKILLHNCLVYLYKSINNIKDFICKTINKNLNLSNNQIEMV